VWPEADYGELSTGGQLGDNGLVLRIVISKI
jgi:hypothetical protein